MDAQSRSTAFAHQIHVNFKYKNHAGQALTYASRCGSPEAVQDAVGFDLGPWVAAGIQMQ